MRAYYRVCQFFCRWFCVLLLKVRVYGAGRVPRTGGLMLVSNHQSFLDPVLLGIALPRECTYMARESLFAHPLFRGLIRSLNAFPVRRNEADIGAIKESLRRLRDGAALVIFPEGTRTTDGRIGPMLPGLAAIARKARVPIVPVLIDGMFRAWPRTRAFPGPGDVVVHYGEPIMPEAYAGLSPGALMEEIRRRLVALQERWHRRGPHRGLKSYGGDSGPS